MYMIIKQILTVSDVPPKYLTNSYIVGIINSNDIEEANKWVNETEKDEEKIVGPGNKKYPYYMVKPIKELKKS